MDQEAFQKLHDQVKEDYDSLGSVRCPFFGEQVRFAADGFQHLLYKGASKSKKRDATTQAMRLKLFKFAPRLIRLTKTVQEYHVEKQWVEQKMNKRKEKVLKDVQYWGFIAIINARKVKVIVKQVGKGEKRFWSIIPNWKTRGSDEIITHSGDLAND